VSSEAQGQSLHIVVKDDGPGVPPEIQERIFDPFFTTREVGEGTGLGLSICHGIMTEHGGRIWVRSDGSRGSEFHLQIPIVRDGSPPADASGASPGTPAGPDRVLVVDDEPSIREMLKAVLERSGHQVDLVADGASAVELARATRYGAILLDVRMPVMNGLEVFRRLEELGSAVTSRVVFMTGDTMAEETRGVVAETGAPSLAKPFDTAELLQILDRVLRAAR
jgi:CheY-like chemotaxis protein